MKKIFSLALISMAICSFAQQQPDKGPKRHELKANVFNLIIFKSPSFSYEYLIDRESSIGASVLFNLAKQEEDETYFLEEPYYNEKFAFTTFYRRYFSHKYAWGFFLEAFGQYNVQRDNDEVYDHYREKYIYSDETSDNMAFGIVVGGKFVSRNGFAFEFFGGVGRNIYTSNSDIATELVPRFGVCLGYRL
ncbi:MAG: DUF3575 domain-containing protein [Flavobacteriales bacterium]|nr:MAG: DUF3575 domain-containing protein [Flavobacteriales bacterium]